MIQDLALLIDQENWQHQFGVTLESVINYG